MQQIGCRCYITTGIILINNQNQGMIELMMAESRKLHNNRQVNTLTLIFM